MNDEIKNRINTLRNILVGKVPNPIEQVNQITNALLYKFMDDQDALAEALGGKKTFFTGDLEQYSWRKIVGDPKLNNLEKAVRYDEGITALSNSKHLPELFQQIFKDQRLPFSPATSADTIVMFLNEVNKFDDYNQNPEIIASAFEHLLSYMGSQGDAGMFRTPYHIIKFIVDVVDPQVGEDIMDPACGTAGFLVEAYRHITENKKLGPKEKQKLADKIHGVDISPEMAKFARVNLYLHGFKEPDIESDDTLSKEKFWKRNKRDVFLANPPFMTPTGGITPHDKFPIPANKTEVLFTEYIVENLKTTGRAGIIVPEGIIFKGDQAYKNLRKMLVEDGLWAVVSLPAGVFRPYAGVKTSILFWDNVRAKENDEILFVKVENDGFDLGAQRRPIDQNDLPQALEILEKWKEGKKQESEKALWVSRKEIAENGDYNLTAERYRKEEVYENQKWEMVELGEVCEIKRGSVITKKQAKEGNIPVVAGGQQPAYFHNEANRKAPVITVSASGAYAGFVNFFTEDIYASDCSTIQPKDNKQVDIRYVYAFLKGKQKEIYSLQQGGGQPHVYPKDLQKIKIPLPPLSVQKEIVEKIEIKQRAIDAAREVIKNLERERRYFGEELRKLEDIEWIKLGEVISLKYGKPLKKDDRKDGDYPVFGSNGIVGNHNKFLVKGPFIIVGRKGTAGAVVYSEKSGFPIDTTFYVKLKDKKESDLKFIYLLLKNLNLGKLNNQAGVPGLNRNDAYKIKIPFPPLSVQKELVAKAEEEEQIIKANQRLIELMEAKIEKIINEI